MDLNVIKKLQALTPVERMQQTSHSVNDDIPPAAINLELTSAGNVPVLNDYFFRNRNIYISKHARFAPYPEHSHQFLEINYMLSGHVQEVVNGTHLTLSEGDVLLLDVGSTHTIGTAGKDDILMNILFRDRNISLDLLKEVQSSKSVLYDFLLNRVHPDAKTPNFLLFTNHHNEEIKGTIERLISEYYEQKTFSDAIIQAELTILLADLIRNYHVETKHTSTAQQIAIKILDDIRTHYRTITLEELSEQYSYNKNYLGNLFRKEVGKTFSQALTEERLIRARELIQTTDQPISSICTQVGISNKSFFYHKYADKFGHTPKDDRKQSTVSFIGTEQLFNS